MILIYNKLSSLFENLQRMLKPEVGQTKYRPKGTGRQLTGSGPKITGENKHMALIHGLELILLLPHHK
jgi:hypothetical protein